MCLLNNKEQLRNWQTPRYNPRAPGIVQIALVHLDGPLATHGRGRLAPQARLIHDDVGDAAETPLMKSLQQKPWPEIVEQKKQYSCYIMYVCVVYSNSNYYILL